MNNQFIVLIGPGTNDLTLETVATVEKLVEAKDVYLAHKKALINECGDRQEVLQIKDPKGKILYTIKEGFARQ